MLSLRDVPIKRKLMLVIMLTTAFALLLMAGTVVTYEYVTFRKSMTVSTGVLAEVVASMSTSSLAFNNEEDAEEVLAVLAAERQITTAGLYDNNGRLFASFTHGAKAHIPPATVGPDGSSFQEAALVMVQPVIQKGGVRVGTLYIRADLREMYERILFYVALVLVSGLGAMAVAAGISTVLQRRISGPIVELAATARAVSERQDYSVRATQHGNDEIGDLTDAFNQMLTRVGEANDALVSSEGRLRLALEGSETGTWDWNLETGQIWWDDYMLPLYGIRASQWQGRPEDWLALIHPEDRSFVSQRIAEVIKERCDLIIAYRVSDSNGVIRHMASRGRVFEDDQGRAVRITGVSMDVSQAKQNEATLQQAKETAEAANRAKDEFLAILSHELRTPLTPVLTTVSMLQSEPGTSPVLLRELETIQRNVELEARLIDDLLDLTRISRGKLELHLAILDLLPLLQHAVQSYLMPQAAKKNQEVTVEVQTTDSTHILGDSPRITQVLWNVLQNACKFTPVGGSIKIRVYNSNAVSSSADQPGQPALAVEISDTGIGIEAAHLTRIFTAFEQGERARTRVFGGLGLGLAISLAIAERHGGSLTAASPGSGKGATFTLLLPTILAPAPEDSGSAGSPCLTPVRQGAQASRILLVEDHTDTARQLSRLLMREGHEVTIASTLAQARQAAGAAHFDLLVSDLGLPDGSGHDLMRELVASKPVPGIALSGYGMEADVKASLAAGFSLHLTKPIHWPELRDAINDMLTRK